MKKLIKMMRFQQAQIMTALLDRIAVNVTLVVIFFQGCYLDPNDLEVMSRSRYPHPSNDPLLVGFYRFQENKRKLLNLLRNPLGNQ